MSKRKRTKEDTLQPKNRKRARANQPKSTPELLGKEASDADDAKALSSGLQKSANEEQMHGTAQTEVQEDPQWAMYSIGGRILDLPPVFSADEKYYILAYTSGVKIFTCETSLIVQSLQMTHHTRIVGLCLSPSDPTILIVGTGSGQLQEWDWITGSLRKTLDLGGKLHAFAVATQLKEKLPCDIIYTALGAENVWTIESCCFGDHGQTHDNRVLFTSDLTICTLQVLAKGRVLVASGGRRVIVGTKRGANFFPIGLQHYRWREYNCTDTIASIKGHISDELATTAASAAIGLDVAVGTQSGFLYIYRDIINQLTASKQSRIPPPVIRLHWHRSTVSALDWSKDGLYLISGGEESVLVLWQLEKISKSFLPHLSAAIRSITVSPSGSFYGVTLDDNSSMVLNVLTLEPLTSVSDPQLFRENTTTRGFLPNSLMLRQNLLTLPKGRIPIATTKQSTKLLFATRAPSFWGDQGRVSHPSPFLHVYDYKDGVQDAKQALARTLVTEKKVDSRNVPLEEPSIVLLRISSDEKWLATVDEWLPPPEFFNGVNALVPLWRDDRLAMLEAHLRFWSWSDTTKTWDMVGKVDLSAGFHSHTLHKSKIILDLIEDPRESQFFTLGDDSVIRAWSLRRQLGNELGPRVSQGRDVVDWTCREVGSLPVLQKQDRTHTLSGRIAISSDNSLMIAAISTEKEGVVSIFDLRFGQHLDSSFDKISGPVRHVEILGSRAIILSDTLVAWDLVEPTAPPFNLVLANISPDRSRSYFHVARDADGESLAIAHPTPEGHTLVKIMLVDGLALHHAAMLPFPVLFLCPTSKSKEYLAINPDSEMTLIKCLVERHAVSKQDDPTIQPTGLSRVFGSIRFSQSARGNTSELELDSDADKGETNANASESSPDDARGLLKKVFDSNQPMSSPSVLNMFRQVAVAMSREIQERK